MTEELPAIIPHPEDRLEELLRASRTIVDSLDADGRLEQLISASRAIELTPIPMASVRLSKFTLKQLSRDNPLHKKKKAKRKQHYKTRRKKQRAANLTIWKKYADHKYELDWQVSREEWEILWDFIGGGAYKIGRYTKEEPYTMENLWVQGKDGTKLWEGYEDRLRRLGCLL